MTAAPDRDVVDLLSTDHRDFDRIFTELEGLLGRTGADDSSASARSSTR